MKFGIIGTNWITDKFIDAGNQIKDFEIAAVYSRTAERAKEFSKATGEKILFIAKDKFRFIRLAEHQQLKLK